MKKKTVLIMVVSLLILLLASIVIGYWLWQKPPKKAERQPGISISADSLYAAFKNEETKANEKYLNRALVVKGMPAEILANLEGGTMVIIETSDGIGAIQCAFREADIDIPKGEVIEVKGFCAGIGITGVLLTGCVLVQ